MDMAGMFFLGKKDIWMAGEGKLGNMLLEILKKLLNNPKPGSEGIGGAGGRRRIRHAPLYI